MEPILSANPIVEDELIVLADYTDLLAYGSNGVLWKTDRLVMDWLKVLNAEPGLIRCSGWDPAHNSDVEIDVDSRTGQVIRQRHLPE